MSVKIAVLMRLVTLVLMLCGAANAEPTSERWTLLDQMSHAGRVTDVFENAETGFAYSSGEDGRLKVWRLQDGIQVADVALAVGRRVKCFAVNPRNPWEVAVAIGDSRAERNEILRVDLKDGRVVRRWSGTAQSLTFSPDGELIAGKSFSTISVWNRDSGSLFVGLQGANEDTSRVQIVAPRTLVYHVDEGINFLDLGTGELLRQIVARDSIDFAVLESANRVADVNSSEYRQWDLTTHSLLFSVKLALRPDRLTVDPHSGDAFLYSRAAVFMSNTRGPMFRIDGKSRELTGIIGEDPEELFTATYAANGVLLNGNTSGRLRRWGFEEKDRIKVLPELGVTRPAIGAIAFSSDRRFLATGDADGTVDVWDSTTGVRRLFDPGNVRPKSPEPHFGSTGLQGVSQFAVVGARKKPSPIAAIHASSGRDEFAVVSQNGDVKIVNAQTLRVSLETSGGGDWVRHVHRTNDNQLYVVGRTTISRWDLTAVKRLTSIALPDVARNSLRFAFAGNVLAFGSDGGVSLFDLDTQRLTNVKMPQPFCISGADDSFVAFAPVEVMMFPITGGRPRTIAPWSSNLQPKACEVRGRSFVIVTYDGRFAAVDIGTVTRKDPEFFHLSAEATALAPLPESNWVLIGDRHGVVHVVDPASGKRGARLINWNYTGWVVIDEQRGFVAPPEAWRMLVFVQNRRPMEVLDPGFGFEKLYRPGLLREMITGPAAAAADSPAAEALQVSTSPPQVRILEPRSTINIEGGSGMSGTWDVTSGGTTMVVRHHQAGEPGATILARERLPAGSVRVRAEVIDAGSGVGVCHVLRNQMVVQYIRDPTISNGRATIEADVSLISGPNELGVQCFGHNDVGSARAVTLVYATEPPSPRERTAYLISVGLNTYKQQPLTYAVDDAELFVSELDRSLKGTGQYQKVVPVRLLEQDATRDNILATLSKLAGKPYESNQRLDDLLKGVGKAGPEDAILFFYAGHGGVIETEYRLLLHGFSLDDLSTTLTDSELRSSFAEIDVRDLALILDSCESGDVLGPAEDRVGPFASRSFAQMAYDKGMFVLVATQSSAVAREPGELKHGLLTHVMLNEGLRERKAFPAGSARLSVREFVEYPVTAVPAWQEQNRRQRPASSAAEPNPAEDRLIKRAGGAYALIQTPRNFVPPFGYNETFLISGKDDQ